MRLLAAYLTSCFLIFSSCKGSLNPSEYFKWNNRPNSEINKVAVLKHYCFDVTYRPIDFMALAQLNGEKLDETAFKKSRKGFECCRHFKILISSKDSSDVLKYKLRNKEEYFERIKYLSNDIQQHLFLIENKDTLPCTYVHYERTYKMKAGATVMAFFERKTNNDSETKPMQLFITRGGFNPDKLTFDFSKEDLNTIPKLSL